MSEHRNRGELPQHQVVDSFSIDRGVANRSRNDNLAFVANLPTYAESVGVRFRAGLGMSAVELARKGEILGILVSSVEHSPWLSSRKIGEALQLALDRNSGGMKDFRTLQLGSAGIYEPVNENPWIGVGIVGDGEARLNRERGIVAQILSDVAERDIELTNTDNFLNIGYLDASYVDEELDDGVDELLDHIDHMITKKTSNEIDVYDVALRRGNLLIPR